MVRTALSNSEAQAIFLKKIELLKLKSYQINDFEIVELEYEDGNSFWHHLNIEVEQNGETFNWFETAYFHEGKLKISEDDPYIQYRDGKMNFKMDE